MYPITCYFAVSILYAVLLLKCTFLVIMSKVLSDAEQGECYNSSYSTVNPHSSHTCSTIPPPRGVDSNWCTCSSSFRRCQTPSFVRLRKSRKLCSNFLFFFFFFSATRRSNSASKASGDPHFFHANSSTCKRRKSIMLAYVELCGFAFKR